MSSRLGRNPFGNRPESTISAPAQTQDFVFAAPELLTPSHEVHSTEEEAEEGLDEIPADEIVELSGLRDFVIRDVPAAALMLAIKGATRLIERSRN